MAGADPEDCCQGAHAASQQGEFQSSKLPGMRAEMGIQEAIETQLDDEQAPPVIIDGLPQ